MNWLYKLLKQDPESREGIITTVSGLGIAVNVIIAALKVIIGALASSMAIVSEGINNATDAMTSILTLVGTRLSGKHPDQKHPFGYGRIEYLTSLVISGLILFTGAELLVSSVRLIFRPETPEISVLSLVIVAVSAVVKFFLGVYTIKKGKQAESGALTGVGLDCRNDAFISVVTILSALVFLLFRLNVDAWCGVFMAALVLKAGIGVLSDTVSNLLGKSGEKELAAQIYKEVRATPGILNAADMMLHDYGPDAYSGSVNVEIDHSENVGDVYARLHALQLRIMHEYHVTMVFGVYAVDNDHEESRKMRRIVVDFVRAHEHVQSYHALYLPEGSDKIYVDLIVDYELRDWDALRGEFLQYMKKAVGPREIELTIETEYV